MHTTTYLHLDNHDQLHVTAQATDRYELNFTDPDTGPLFTIFGDREQLADLLRTALTALYAGTPIHPAAGAVAVLAPSRWQFGHTGMTLITEGGDDAS